MKKSFWICVIASFCFILISCLNNSEEERAEFKKFEDYEFFGEIHNEYLEYASNEYPKHGIFGLPKQDQSLKKINLLKGFTHTNSNLEGVQMFQGPEKNNEMIEMISHEDIFKKHGDYVSNLLNDLVENESIAQEDKELIDELFSFILNEAESYDEITVKIDLLITNWNAYRFQLNTADGVLSAAVLSIAKHSFEFWDENYDALNNIHNYESLTRIWWVVARIAAKDAFSGLVGSGVGAIVEGLIEGEAQPWGYKELGKAFISSAICGSIGV